jgi:plastocyanin
MNKLFALLSVLALTAFGLAACGGGNDESSSSTSASTTESTSTTAGGGGGAGGTVSISADPGGALAFTTDSVSTKAGDVTIKFDNPSSTGHDVVIEDADGNEVARTDVITGDSAETTATLEAGDYTFFCSVDAHRDAGMEGTLTAQ